MIPGKTVNKKNIIITIALVVAAAFILVFFVYSGNYINKSVSNYIKVSTETDPLKAEADKIKNDNKDILSVIEKAGIKKVGPISAEDHIRGNIGAPVQIIVYDDFACPFCARYADTLKEVEEFFGDQVAIAFRHFPLRSHSNALSAAMAAECAAEQGKFWEMHDLLFTANKAGTLGREQYLKDAKELGLNTTNFVECLDSRRYMDKIQAEWQSGVDYGVNGTPGNFINGVPYAGAVPFMDYKDSQGTQREGLKSIIESYLDK